MTSTTVRDRALGAFLGLAVGDALGTTLEFKRRDTYEHLTEMVGGGPFRLAPGQWTDDTSMAICLAESLLNNGGKVVPRDLACAFVRWWDKGENSVTGRCFDIGHTTRTALENFCRTGKAVGLSDEQSAGNGGIMRLAPAVLVAGNDGDLAARLAIQQSGVTHAAPECLEAAAAMGRFLHAAIHNRPGIWHFRNDAWMTRKRDQVSSSGYVIDTLEAALWACAHGGGFKEAVLLAVNLGRDADTVGAVTGQLAGALYGLSDIPSAWLKKLAWRGKLIALGNQLFDLGERVTQGIEKTC